MVHFDQGCQFTGHEWQIDSPLPLAGNHRPHTSTAPKLLQHAQLAACKMRPLPHSRNAMARSRGYVAGAQADSQAVVADLGVPGAGVREVLNSHHYL